MSDDDIKGEAFAKTEPAAGFDIESWLAGASLPERTVTVYGDGKGYADLQDLIAACDEARRAEDDVPEEDQGINGGEPLMLARKVEAKRKALESSRLTLRFRAILLEDAAKIRKAHKGKGDDDESDEIAYHTLAAQSVSPSLTAEQFAAIRSKIGEGQFQAILTAASQASYEAKVEVPFSLSASALLAARGSSSS